MPGISERAALHAALADANRLRIVDDLVHCDRTPGELQARLGLPSNLVAHHLDVLERCGLVRRRRSDADRRRRYVALDPATAATVGLRAPSAPVAALFLCTANSARSPLAAALWRELTGADADSAGVRPADSFHPGAVAAARRAGLRLGRRSPRALGADEPLAPLVVTVCDHAALEMVNRLATGSSAPDRWWHWSLPDPVRAGEPAGFDRTISELTSRIGAVAA